MSSYLTALGSVLAIIAIVIVGGVIIAYLGKIIIGIFDADRTLDKNGSAQQNIRTNEYNNTYNETKTYAETKVAEDTNHVANKVESNYSSDDEDYDYAKEVDVNEAKREREALEREIKGSSSQNFMATTNPVNEEKVEDNDDFFSDYKKSIAADMFEEEHSEEPEPVVAETKTEPTEDSDIDDLDIMNMIDEISNDVIEDKRTEVKEKEEEESKNTASILDKYSLDSLFDDDEEDEEDEEDDEPLEVKPSVADESLEEMRNIKSDIMTMLEEIKNNKPSKEEEEERIDNEVAKRVDEKLSENLQIIEDLRHALEEKEHEVETIKSEQKDIEEKYNKINKEMVEQLQSQNRDIETSIQSSMNESFDQIHQLKLQLAELTKQLQEERSMNWKVVETTTPETKVVKGNENKKVEASVAEEYNEPVIVETENTVVAPEVLQEIHQEQIVNQVEERLEETSIEVSELVKKVEEITNKQILSETVKDVTREVVTMQYSTEQQYLNRIAVLEERLKFAKKDLKINDKEYKPLEKVKRTLDRDKAKLRRKEAIAAKKKVALYGVNNYVDIDKEKAEKLAHELELLDGLRLSVSHCEEVMNNNKERYPILEHTHIILTNNIKDLEADIAQLNKELQMLRDGEDE